MSGRVACGKKLQKDVQHVKLGVNTHCEQVLEHATGSRHQPPHVGDQMQQENENAIGGDML